MADSKVIFDRYIRPGSRCEKIVTGIRMGMTDEELAARFDRKNIQGGSTCLPSDIAVYRKALNGQLSSGTESAMPKHWHGETFWAEIGRMLGDGLTKEAISKQLDVNDKTARYYIKRYREMQGGHSG